MSKKEDIYMHDSENEECLPEASPQDYLDYSLLKKVRVAIIWDEKVPRTKQLLVLKKVYHSLRAMSDSDLIKQISHGTQWEFTIMWLGEALDLLNEAKKLGLTIELKE